MITIADLWAKSPSKVRIGLAVRGMKTGVGGVLIPPMDGDFQGCIHFFYEDDRPNPYAQFRFEDCHIEVVLNAEGEPVYHPDYLLHLAFQEPFIQDSPLWFLGRNPTVDLVLAVPDLEGEGPESWSVLMVQRATEPFSGYWALPGGFVDAVNKADTFFAPKESPEAAARRELEEETGCATGKVIPVGIFTGNKRDPRDGVTAWTESHAFLSILDVRPATTPQEGEVKACRWIPWKDLVDGVVPCAFDHKDILIQAGKIST